MVRYKFWSSVVVQFKTPVNPNDIKSYSVSVSQAPAVMESEAQEEFDIVADLSGDRNIERFSGDLLRSDTCSGRHFPDSPC